MCLGDVSIISRLKRDEILFALDDVLITKQDVATAITELDLEWMHMFLAKTIHRQYEWDARSHKYKHEGKVISNKEVYTRAEFMQEKSGEKIARLSRTDNWKVEAKEQIKREYIRQYMLGRGGYEQMTSVDWGRVGAGLRTQYRYLNADPERWDNYSDGQFGNILSLYTDSATQMFEKGRVATYAVNLPAYPGDGSTECGSRCNCTWEYENDKNGFVVAYWTLGWVKTDHCETCLGRAQTWNPYEVL